MIFPKRLPQNKLSHYILRVYFPVVRANNNSQNNAENIYSCIYSI